MKEKILEFFDFNMASNLLEDYNKSTGFVTAILDLEGNILSKSGWRQICTDFHRKHPKTSHNCNISDTVLCKQNQKDDKCNFYKCLNGLIDVQAPIIIKGKHIANLFSGQLFFEEPDISFFKKQAKTYGFNEKAYIEALKKVPVFSKKEVETNMKFLQNIMQLLIEITAERINQIELNEKFRATLLSVGDGVISTDRQGRINVMNRVAAELTGWTQQEAYNKPLEKVLNIINEYTRETYESPAKKALQLGKTVEMENHTILISKDGKEIPIEDSASPIKDRNGKVRGAVIVFRDFSEKREKQKEIEHLSFHDHLTGLYNRRYMEDSIKRLDTDRNIPFSIIVADINGLKLTNDTYGHEMGDKLLISASEILKKSCRKEDIISRVGGDEFVILLPKTDGKTTKEIIKRIKEEADKTKLDSVIVSIATGCSTKHKEDEDIFKIHKEADNNMYKDKLKIGRIMRSKTIETLLVNINNKYDNEHIHTERVSQYCESIAKAMNLNEKDIQDAKIAGVLHDIGKIVVNPELLNKKDKLTNKEWEEIKKHPTSSYQILKNVDEYAHLAEDVLYHHERLDGKGYPEGLKEDEIPLLSKIISVADAYEAMTADRPYKTKKTKEQAIEELKKYSGSQFDKKIVDVFVNEVL